MGGKAGMPRQYLNHLGGKAGFPLYPSCSGCVVVCHCLSSFVSQHWPTKHQPLLRRGTATIPAAPAHRLLHFNRFNLPKDDLKKVVYKILQVNNYRGISTLNLNYLNKPKDYKPIFPEKGIFETEYKELPIDYFCSDMEGTKRANIQPGLEVKIILKQHQQSGQLTEGFVKDILTKAVSHPHGIKVRLDTGQIGRVKEIINFDE